MLKSLLPIFLCPLVVQDNHFRYVWGHGQHSGKHGGAILPDTLRWLWRK